MPNLWLRTHVSSAFELLVTFSDDAGKLLIMSKRIFLRVMCAKKEI